MDYFSTSTFGFFDALREVRYDFADRSIPYLFGDLRLPQSFDSQSSRFIRFIAAEGPSVFQLLPKFSSGTMSKH